MLSHAPSIMLSFAVEEPTAIASLTTQPPLTEAQRLKAIESYALIAASHPVSVRIDLTDSQPSPPNHLTQSTQSNIQIPSPTYLRNSAPSNLTKLSKNKPVKASLPPVSKKQSSLGLSMRLKDTFRNYVRQHVSNQISYPQKAMRHRPSRELRQLFANHEETANQSERQESNSLFNKMPSLTESRPAYCQS